MFCNTLQLNQTVKFVRQLKITSELDAGKNFFLYSVNDSQYNRVLKSHDYIKTTSRKTVLKMAYPKKNTKQYDLYIIIKWIFKERTNYIGANFRIKPTEIC